MIVGATVTGWPAFVIIVAILVIFGLGVRAAIREMARGARRTFKRRDD
jgi:hypothetical protein